ncbi:YTH domain-containing family protein 1 [Hypsizygus marmoreus]|uniref:YTH domain-containing family protein 1 n=1 Tax=Hypsizygus marmoreus TaxID=39966 RepID=A0A369JI51_HYPMA|nr:YTH domain-containing family protein 1 [Hypsizygus marmoreus]
MSSQANPPPPPVPASPPNSGGVRRHHTISASSRTARAAARESISEETQEQPLWNDDEVVDEDWVGGVGAVGEKTSLHRQSSLPTRYHRGFQGASKTGILTPKTVNSLAAIAGHEGDEEPWNIAGGYSAEDEHPDDETAQHQQGIDPQSKNSPLSPHFAGVPHGPSPPPAASNVRRHVSLTYGSGVAGPRKMNPSGLKRSGTLQAAGPVSSQNTTPPSTSEGAEEDEYPYEVEDASVYEEEYTSVQYQQYSGQQGQYAGSPIGRQSPWAPGNEWRTAGGSGFTGGNGGSQNATMDDVQRALSALELNQAGASQMYQGTGNYQTGQSAHPPRFNPTHPPPAQAPGMRGGNSGNGNRGLQLNTDSEGRRTPSQGGSGFQQQYQQQQDNRGGSGGSWDNRDRILGTRTSNPNLQYGYQKGGQGIPSVPAIPQQYLQQQQQQPRMGSSGSPFSQTGGQQQGGASGQASGQPFVSAPIDVPSLIATKGYNPTNFDTRPQFARFFVIKSYTEDDVHKSLKYEIWSSTDPGNKRLDKAFKETAGRGPIYLFFSVNASGHFCGMAEMLTPVDYTKSSTVWASDKWKGVFKVQWIFVRDIPNVNLRHIKLNNTQERKPVTNSRDTQELLPDAGQEMLRIFHTHPARTSLLQDFAFYELQAMQKQQGASSPPQSPDSTGASSPQPQAQQPQPLQQQQQQQNIFAMNPNALGYAMPQMTPLMQMQMQMGMMGMGGAQYGIPQAQAMHQSVMRHPSPGPQNVGGQGFMGF